jgi:hypothetical protein
MVTATARAFAAWANCRRKLEQALVHGPCKSRHLHIFLGKRGASPELTTMTKLKRAYTTLFWCGEGATAENKKSPISRGLDLSPASWTALKLKNNGLTEWCFEEADAVPAGPWSEIVTISGVDWK